MSGVRTRAGADRAFPNRRGPGRFATDTVGASVMAGLVQAIHAVPVPVPASPKLSGGLTTSPNALAFGWMPGTSPIMTAWGSRILPLSSNWTRRGWT